MNWKTALTKSSWLEHVGKCLISAVRVQDQMLTKKKTVLVHCSDGWDRTAQICSLVRCCCLFLFFVVILFRVVFGLVFGLFF